MGGALGSRVSWRSFLTCASNASSSKPLQQEPQQPAVELLLQHPPAPYGVVPHHVLQAEKMQTQQQPQGNQPAGPQTNQFNDMTITHERDTHAAPTNPSAPQTEFNDMTITHERDTHFNDMTITHERDTHAEEVSQHREGSSEDAEYNSASEVEANGHWDEDTGDDEVGENGQEFSDDDYNSDAEEGTSEEMAQGSSSSNQLQQDSPANDFDADTADA